MGSRFPALGWKDAAYSALALRSQKPGAGVQVPSVSAVRVPVTEEGYAQSCWGLCFVPLGSTVWKEALISALSGYLCIEGVRVSFADRCDGVSLHQWLSSS